MEAFADTLGVRSYEKCGGAIFTNLTNVIPTAAHVVEQIDQGLFYDRANQIVDWWKTGIQWETILPAMFSVEICRDKWNTGPDTEEIY